MALVQYTNEYSRLKRVALYKPAIDEIEQKDAKAAMYMDIPDAVRVLEEFDGVVEKLRSLDVEVVVLEPRSDMPKTSNMLFLRDVALPFRNEIVLANMKHPIRSEEPEKFMKLLTAKYPEAADHFIKHDKSVSVEGADVFVMNEGLLYIYTGNRTSSNVGLALRQIFPGLDIKTIEANITGVPQHILGGVHILDDGLASRRVEYCTDQIQEYKYIDFKENTETRGGFSLNILTLSPREILMPANNPATKARLEANGIICHEVEISEIHKMGGGLACMALPLFRE